jgi:hypothetical protein
MATKKRAQLVAGLLEGRRTKPSATLHVLPLDPCERSAEEIALSAVAIAEAPHQALRRRAAAKGTKRRGDLSAVPIATRQTIPSAAEAAFHQKGSATAASFRPWYWQY